MKNPYGLHNGVLITANNAERGLKCNCVCPACGEKLQAHKGKKKRAYFSHYNGSDCGYGLETATHMLAKEVIRKEMKVILPEHNAHPRWDELEYIRKQYKDIGFFKPEQVKKVIVEPWTIVKVDTVTLEKKMGSIVPDIIVEVNTRVLYIEIKVTHGIDDIKLNYIQSNNLNVIEYDFSKSKERPDPEHLTRVLTQTYKGAKKGKGRGAWINHCYTKESSDELTMNLKKQYPPKKPWELKKRNDGSNPYKKYR